MIARVAKSPAHVSATTRRRLRHKSHRVTALLNGFYGSPHHDNKDDPLDELIFIILSQMTTQESFGRAFVHLRETIKSWDNLLTVNLQTLITFIKGAGLSRQKGPRLKAIAHRLQHDFGKVSLAPLFKMSDLAAERYLISLPGVGTKTAKCVLMYSLRRKVLPIDTHVLRVSRRLGLINETVACSDVHPALEQVVRPADRYLFHVTALSHGRDICTARYPRCNRCALTSLCLYHNRIVSGSSGFSSATIGEHRYPFHRTKAND
jgi:endonuclease III